MINDMKAYEMNEMEMNEVTGGFDLILHQTTQELVTMYTEQNLGEKQDEAFFNAVSTAWEVVKYAFDLCG